MKKILLVLAIMVQGAICFSQEIKVIKNETIYKSYNFVRLDDQRQNEKYSKYWDFCFSFQNNKYKTITDIKSIFLKTDELKKFSDLLKQMIDSQEKELEVNCDLYSLYKISERGIYIYDSKKSGYTILSKTEINDLNNIVKEIK
jgi:hypothetical protein